MATDNRRRSNRRPATPGIEQQVVEGILKGIWWLVTLPFQKKGMGGGSGTASRTRVSAQSAQELAAYWSAAIADRPGQGSDVSPSVMEADKLVDMALKDMNIPGTTMGERLRASEHLFSPDLYNRLWQAHKLRNHAAHEMGAYIQPEEGRSALRTFQEALRTLGVGI